jgi:hypothetical protein
MNKKQQLVFDILKLLDENDASMGFVWWRTDGEYAPCTFMVNCNDEFAFASADCESITKDNFATLRLSFIDCEELYKHGKCWGPMLFCARVKQQRPQGSTYDSIPLELWPLFDACGPVREINGSNPYGQGQRKQERELAEQKKMDEQSAKADKVSKLRSIFDTIISLIFGK